MSSFQELAIQEALRSALGKKAKFGPYGRENRTPMNLVLDEVERQIGPRFAVYWLDTGPPEVFCLPGFSPSPVIFSRRHLSLTALMRHLFVDDRLRGAKREIAERTALKLISEMALRYGDADLAVLALMKSAIEKGIWLLDNDELVMALERGPVHEAYMVTWFYGLVHELGHLHPNQTRASSEGDKFPDGWMVEAITAALDSLPYLSRSIKEGAIETAKQRRSDSVIGIDQLRNEGWADIFACSVLFQSTFDIMREINQKRFQVARFIAEVCVFLKIIALIERCRRVALIASATVANRDAQSETLLHPAPVLVRALMQRSYLNSAVTTYLYGPEPAPEQFRRVDNFIDNVNQHFKEAIAAVDSGLARAIEFVLSPGRRESASALVEEFRKELPRGRTEALRFCELADAFEKDCKLLTVLKSIVNYPTEAPQLYPANLGSG